MKSKNKKRLLMTVMVLQTLSACSTLEQSLQLGGGMGAIAGGAVTLGGYSAAGKTASVESVAIGAGIGMVVGLATSYFTHQSVAQDRKSCETEQIEMHFGDLPPSPFIVPKSQTQNKKGSR